MVITGVNCFIGKLINIIVIYLKLYQHNDITWGYIRRSAYIFSLPCILEIFNLHQHLQVVVQEVSWAFKTRTPPSITSLGHMPCLYLVIWLIIFLELSSSPPSNFKSRLKLRKSTLLANIEANPKHYGMDYRIAISR